MTAIFISHRSSDIAEAQALKDWLGEQGHERLSLDFGPDDGIPAGVNLEQRPYQELRCCQVLLFALTPAWLASKRCGNELAIAREKGRAVFVVLVNPCAGGPLTPALQEVQRGSCPKERLMPSPAFTASLPFILRWEGGYVNHPSDPGGATNKGVIQRVYDDWRRRQGRPTRDVRQLEDTEMQAIYEAGYWLPPRCDLLQRQLDLVQFDTAVNMGVGRAVRMLQGALGCDVDSDFGPATRQAAEACSLGATIKAYCDAREGYYRRLAEQRPKLAVFLKGWLNRLNALRNEVGLPGYEAAVPLDFGDANYIAKIPDLGENRDYDL